MMHGKDIKNFILTAPCPIVNKSLNHRFMWPMCMHNSFRISSCPTCIYDQAVILKLMVYIHLKQINLILAYHLLIFSIFKYHYRDIVVLLSLWKPLIVLCLCHYQISLRILSEIFDLFRSGLHTYWYTDCLVTPYSELCIYQQQLKMREKLLIMTNAGKYLPILEHEWNLHLWDVEPF